MTSNAFAQSFDSLLNYEVARTNMLKQQIRTWEVLDKKILDLFFTIPRENFVPPSFKSLAFADISIPLSQGQKMMPPKEEARVLQELKIQPDNKILIVGMDSGFLTTCLSQLANQVYCLHNELASFEEVKHKCATLHNVTVLIGSLHEGWQETSPFDLIILTGSLLTFPASLKNALTLAGRLFGVVGNLPVMEAMLITRLSTNTWKERKLFETVRPRLLDTWEDDHFNF